MSIFENIFRRKKESVHLSKSESKLHVLDFEKYDEFGQIVTLFDYIFNDDSIVANKAAQTIHRLFVGINVFKNRFIYETFRYLRISEKDIEIFSQFDKEVEITFLCIASMNGNGYIREKVSG